MNDAKVLSTTQIPLPKENEEVRITMENGNIVVRKFRKGADDSKQPVQINSPVQMQEDQTVQVDLKQIVTDLMHEIGTPAHLDGYEYLRTSIMMAVEDAKVLNGITKILYPTIAKKCSSTDSGVERSIRTAIEVTWSRGNKETVNKIFGNTVSASTGRPTNSEFIALIADHIRMKLRG